MGTAHRPLAIFGICLIPRCLSHNAIFPWEIMHFTRSGAMACHGFAPSKLQNHVESFANMCISWFSVICRDCLVPVLWRLAALRRDGACAPRLWRRGGRKGVPTSTSRPNRFYTYFRWFLVIFDVFVSTAGWPPRSRDGHDGKQQKHTCSQWILMML